MTLADDEGLEATSMRRIAAKVGAGAMTLYQYVPSREDLIELMVDEVYGELDTTIEEPGPDAGTTTVAWRRGLAQRAEQLRELGRSHPWLATWLPGHPNWGPHSLACHEWLLAAFDGFAIDIDETVSLLGLLRGYVEGFVRAEVGWAEEERRTKRSHREWIKDARPHAVQIAKSGRYPRYARVLAETKGPLLEPDAAFDYGLQRVLDAIAARLGEAHVSPNDAATEHGEPTRRRR